MDKRRKLLVHGYVNIISKQIHKDIPNDIAMLIFLFYDIKLNSTFLQGTEIQYIYKILPDTFNIDGFELLLRASQHGFDKETFHKLCDFKSPILSLVISVEGDVFGGYSNLQWSQAEKWKGDQKLESFIFVLRASEHNKEALAHKPPFKWFVKKDFCGRALYDYHDGFGYGLDWFIGWDTNIQTDRANQRLGHSYGPLSGGYKSTVHFNTIIDYEIWQIIRQ